MSDKIPLSGQVKFRWPARDKCELRISITDNTSGTVYTIIKDVAINEARSHADDLLQGIMRYPIPMGKDAA